MSEYRWRASLLPLGDDVDQNQLGEEYYPEAIGGTIRHASKFAGIPVIVTENGLPNRATQKRTQKPSAYGLRNVAAPSVCHFRNWARSIHADINGQN